jgi:hypothetical protein
MEFAVISFDNCKFIKGKNLFLFYNLKCSFFGPLDSAAPEGR